MAGADRVQIRVGTSAAATSAGDTLLTDTNGAEIAVTDDRTAGVGDVRGWLADGNSHASQVASQPRGIWATPGDLAADIAAAVTGLLDFKGATNCSANPNYPSASKGDTYVVSVAGKIGGASGKSVDVGDMYLATADNAGGTEASVGTSWSVLEHNLVGALLAANNLSDVGSASTARSNLGLVIGTNVAPATSGAVLLKGDGAGGTAAAVSGTDYRPVFNAQLTATSTLTNSTTETTQWTPANFAAAGLTAHVSLFRLRLGGTFDNIATSGTFTIRVKVNGTTVVTAQIAASQNSAATVSQWNYDTDLFVDATGGSGQVTSIGNFSTYAAGAGVNPRPVAVTVAAISLTAGFQVTVTGQMGTANASNTLRVIRGVLEQVS